MVIVTATSSAPPFPTCHNITPSFYSWSKRGNTATSLAAFSIDTQGQIPYTSTYKKGVHFITIYVREVLRDRKEKIPR
jgi:hypothetical protein